MPHNSQEDTRRRLNDIAHAVNERLPSNFGFFVMVFPFNGNDQAANYVSNSKREDVIKVMKEFLFRAGVDDQWMKHINP